VGSVLKEDVIWDGNLFILEFMWYRLAIVALTIVGLDEDR
jgi:hypothetical protein